VGDLRLIYFLIVVIALLAAGLLYQLLGIRRDAVRHPPPGRLVKAGAQRLHVYETGEGDPTVILEAGISATICNWQRVQPEIAKFTRVLSYDRAGLGWSDRARTPRTVSQIVEELHKMLLAADVPPPYVLVGHSFGGIVARLYTMRYPNEVGGIVLVDPVLLEEWHPLSPERKRMLVGGALLSRWGGLLARFGVVRFTLARLVRGRSRLPRAIGRATSSGKGLATMERLVGEVQKMPRELWPAIVSHWSHPKSFASMGDHLAKMPESVASVIDAAPLDVPVTMLTGVRSLTKWPADGPARISTNTTHIVAENSGHWVQLDEPDLVIEAVREMISRVREGAISLR
jgi:pimeloyl-ACP methyl ester carboxylesterase